MRIFEIAMVSLLLVGGVWSLASGTRGGAILTLVFGLLLVLLVVHLAIEGAHWQMAPAYLGVLVFAGLLFFRNPSGPMPAAGVWGMIALGVVASCLSTILPMFRLPRPTGSFAIGTRVMYLVDRSRAEEALPGAGGPRELMVQIWYPAGASHNKYAPYRRRRETTFVSSYQSALRTHSRWGAPVIEGGDAFPVLLFNPSWNGRRTQNTYLVEDLASHGYIVAGVDHTYNSEPVAFPDGRVIHFIPVAGMQDFSQSTLEEVRAIGQKELDKQTADDIFILNRLQAMNDDPKSPIYGRLDTNCAGAFGHSFGGAVAAQACYLDPRIRAALDMDGSLFGEVQRQGLRKPFMMIGEEAPRYTAEEMAQLPPGRQIVAKLDAGDQAMWQKSEGYRLILAGVTHVSFTDKALFSPLKRFSGAGRMAPRREYRIIREYALAFFDEVLKGKSSSLLASGTSPFPEIRFEANRSTLK